MQKLKTITLAEGDSALIIRTVKEDEAYDVEILHHFPNKKDMSDDEVAFYTLLLRGMADYAMNNPEALIEQGQLSFSRDFNQLHTIH